MSVYSNEHNDYTTQRRTKPGTARGEPVYGTVLDVDGRRVSAKPANNAMLAAKRARRQKREEPAGLPFTVRLLLSTLFIPLLSHFLTGTYTFGYGPSIVSTARNAWYSERNPFFQPKVLTLVQLSSYDGRPENPVYLSIGGDVYDVSANRRIYGQGGSYNMMAGRDASRAFVTGCFETHLTHDLRGLSDKELEALEHWKSFFADHDSYFRIGRAILPPINPNSPVPPSCNEKAPGENVHAAKPDPVRAT